jgi:hypothetical protein
MSKSRDRRQVEHRIRIRARMGRNLARLNRELRRQQELLDSMARHGGGAAR